MIFLPLQASKQTKPEKNMMPGTNDDLVGKKAAQNKDDESTLGHEKAKVIFLQKGTKASGKLPKEEQ
jgi:hypothetical protein